MMNYYYTAEIDSFLQSSTEEVIGAITVSNQFDSTLNQNKSWEQQIPILKNALTGFQGTLFFEFAIPRMGKRVDALVIIHDIVLVIEFKVGETLYHKYAINQVWDYALDLKNFHKPSHELVIVPILVASEASNSFIQIATTVHDDKILIPIKVGKGDLRKAIEKIVEFSEKGNSMDGVSYATGVYSPTPTIIEAAASLYNNHSVEAITRSDAEAINLTKTTNVISNIIEYAKEKRRKVLCLVTGVPGAGKTLVGLKVATTHLDKEKGNTSVYLSGNAPLVAILQEALTRDKVSRELERGVRLTKSEAKQAVKAFIQIIHHYRDEYLINKEPPYDHVAIFDEAQRAWNREQTVKFMRQKKNQIDFDFSEPEFLISCLDRHDDWAVIVCLVGGGQEINTGEGGISEWLEAIYNRFPNWEVAISSNLIDSEYSAVDSINKLESRGRIWFNEDLHLSVSMRSFRAEKLSLFVKHVLDIRPSEASTILSMIQEKYPIVLTRDLARAKVWLKQMARGSERYGMVVSSQAQRLKPLAIDVKSEMNPVNWFLNEKEDIRSSYFLEDVATEFHVQGLELDWVCVTWDGDLRFANEEWGTYSFKGTKWQRINNTDRKKYLINAYRVLLTRARQGMVLVIPDGSIEDNTRKPEYYDSTFEYFQRIGIPII